MSRGAEILAYPCLSLSPCLDPLRDRLVSFGRFRVRSNHVESDIRF
jgi:hypothetical protein